VTKLQAADLARRSGAAVVIANGDGPDILVRLCNGEATGTRFTPVATAVESRKRYLLAGRGADGKLWVDDGAVQALRRGGSLLPVGIVEVEGKFDRGDTICVLDPTGREIARGLTNYTSADLIQIRGIKSDSIEEILGTMYGDEVVHHDNMVLL
jgi:glutamate 5-kinase